MKHKPDIEQLLEHTQVPKVTMDANAKDRILFELLQKTTTQKVAPIIESKKPWWQTLFLPQFVAIGSALAVIAFVAIWIVYTPEETQLTNTNVNTQLPVNEKTEVANTNSNKNLNQPPEKINDTPVEIPTEIAVETTTPPTEFAIKTTTTPELTPRAERINGVASLYLGLGGGHPDLDGLTFSFARKAAVSDNSRPRPLITLRTLYDSELHTLANVFPIDSADSEISTFGGGSHVLMNITGNVPHDQLFGRCVDLFGDHVNDVQRCVSISEYGRIDLMQSVTVAQANGMDEAFGYITKLTKHDQQDFITVDSKIEGATEYDIYYKYSLNDELTMRDTGWHVTLQDGKLISLIGYFQPGEANSKATDTISSAEAYDRFVQAYEFQDTTNPHFTRTQSYEYSDLVNSFVEIGPAVAMNVDEIELEYMPAEVFNTGKETDTAIIQLVPVYRVHGHLNSTTEEFTVYIDATRSGDLFSTRFLIYNIGFIR